MVGRIVFPKVSGLSFKIENVDGKERACSEDAFPDISLLISRRKWFRALYTLFSIAESERGRKNYSNPFKCFASRIQMVAKMGANVTLSSGFFRYIPSFKVEQSAAPFVCTIDSKGRLITDSLAGVSYLFAYYVALAIMKVLNLI